MIEKKKISKAREQVLKILNQAKDSLKVLQTLEKETMAKARTFVPEQRRLTNEKILTGLKRMGVATQDEVQALSSKIKSLESAMGRPARTKSAPKSASKT
jgi:hypothetical protein